MKAMRLRHSGAPAVLVDAGIIRPIVEAVLPLDRAREAYERGIKHRPRGKLVLAVVGEDGSSSDE